MPAPSSAQTNTCWPRRGKGATPSSSSSGAAEGVCAEARGRSIPACVRTAPFGRPVVPEVKRSAADGPRPVRRSRRAPRPRRQRTIDERFRRRRLQPCVDLGLRQQDVERHRDRSEAENAEVRGHVVGRVRQLDRDAVVGLDASGAQRCGGDRCLPVELAIRDPLTLEQQRRPVGMAGGAPARTCARFTSAAVAGRQASAALASPPLLRERRAEQRSDLAVLDPPHPHRVELEALMVLPREEDLPAGVTSPRSFVSSASLILSRVAPPLSIAALYAQSAPAASPSKFETGRLRIFRSSAACARTGFDFGRNVHAVARNELTIAPFTSPHVPWRNWATRRWRRSARASAAAGAA